MTQLTCTQVRSRHFRLQELADGVYAALHVGGGAAIGFESYKERAAADLASTQAQYQATHDESQRRQLAVWIDYHQGFLEAEPTLEVRLPNVTFTERLALQGTRRAAELIPFTGGHCASDCVLFLPQEGIVFMSDLLFIGYHPWLGEGDPDKLLGILKAIDDLDPKNAGARPWPSREARQPEANGTIRLHVARTGAGDGRR